ncbi:hypothetical protein BDV96DRAFT_650033 [Lophiotrema nucula]|uniref:Uncharacterized protein n=1 Tax=Lophiotrema nucula TaxID=690887 RepID=A0A6A5YWI2_9PLEO|nr:hypothetical protein BDV96DRAFT_650033 [Lophiotrema nucula]
MPPKLQRDQRRLQSRQPSLLGMDEQQKDLIREYPNPEQQPFRVRLPAHPEAPERDQVLYKVPRYQHPHTLSFMNKYGPEAEEQMIWEFKRARGEAIPPAATFNKMFHNSIAPEPAGKHAGWGAYIVDLATMGFGWVVQQLGLPTPDLKSIPVIHQAAGTKRKRDDDVNRIAEKPDRLRNLQLDSQPRHNYRPAIESDSDNDSSSTDPATPPPTKLRRTRARPHCVRNGGGPTSYLPIDAFDDAGSDTEEDTDVEADKVLLAKYANKEPQDNNRPIETVFGAGIVVHRSLNGTLRVSDPKAQQESRVASPLLQSAGSKAEIKLPSLWLRSVESSA